MPSADLTERLRGDDTTAPVLVKSKTDIGLCSAYLRMMIDRSAAAVRLAGLVIVVCTPQPRRLARWFGIVLADGYAHGSRLLAAPAHVDAATECVSYDFYARVPSSRGLPVHTASAAPTRR
jgi:hypothetical protein